MRCSLLGPEPESRPSLTYLSSLLSYGPPSVLPPWTLTCLLGNLGAQGSLPWGGWSGADAPEPRRSPVRAGVHFRSLVLSLPEGALSSLTCAMGGKEAEGPGPQGSGLHPLGPHPVLGHPSCLFPRGRSGPQLPPQKRGAPQRPAHCWAPALEAEKEHTDGGVLGSVIAALQTRVGVAQLQRLVQ